MPSTFNDFFYLQKQLDSKFIYTTGSVFPGGSQSVGSIKSLCETMAVSPSNMTSPTAGGSLTVDGRALGSYDYVIKTGDINLSTYTTSEWFTSTQDSASAFIVVRGNLTIPSNTVLVPSVRKLFTVLYVDGNLTVDGSISMTGRGAAHSLSSTTIVLAAGTYSGISTPSVPSSGGSGGLGGTDPDGAWGAAGAGNPGGAGTNGGTGGGGGGSHYYPMNVGSASRGGDGAAGSSFSGGSAGGSYICWVPSGGNAGANGGAGGNSMNYYGGINGGSGNPTGYGCRTVWPGPSSAGTDSTIRPTTGNGGVLVIFVTGTYSGIGSVEARGTSWGSVSGGGSVTIFSKTDNGPTPNASSGGVAGSGGVGTARKLALP